MAKPDVCSPTTAASNLAPEALAAAALCASVEPTMRATSSVAMKGVKRAMRETAEGKALLARQPKMTGASTTCQTRIKSKMPLCTNIADDIAHKCMNQCNV